MIEIRQHRLAGTRAASSGSVWLAEAVIDGQRYAARSRHGAPNALARTLVEAGIEDQPVEVRHAGLLGAMRYKSLHRMAAYTYTEGDAPLRRRRYVPRPGNFDAALTGEGKKAGISPEDGQDSREAAE